LPACGTRKEQQVSYPYPQDRTRDRQTEGEQPYQDARQAMRESEAAIQAGAEAFGESHQRQEGLEQAEPLEERVVDDLRRVGEERQRG
jgi:hypothetical protein